jgi:F-box interacting protein
MYHCIRVELFESATWKWKLLDEVKLPHEESLHRMTKVSVNGSLHWLTWKRNVFAFDVKRESHCLFPLPLPASEGNDVRLTEYKGKLAMTSIDRERNFMEVWIMEDHGKKQWSKRHSINIGVLTRKKPHVSPLAFCNADVVLMGEYFPDVIFFNFKTWHIDMLRLGKGLLHGCFPFQLTFATKEKA